MPPGTVQALGTASQEDFWDRDPKSLGMAVSNEVINRLRDEEPE